LQVKNKVLEFWGDLGFRDKDNKPLSCKFPGEEDLRMDEKLEIIQGDIQNMSAIKSSTIDYLISIYNPVSFIKSPLSFFKENKKDFKIGRDCVSYGSKSSECYCFKNKQLLS